MTEAAPQTAAPEAAPPPDVTASPAKLEFLSDAQLAARAAREAEERDAGRVPAGAAPAPNGAGKGGQKPAAPQGGRVVPGGGPNGEDLVVTDAQLADPAHVAKIFASMTKRAQKVKALEQRTAQPAAAPADAVSLAELRRLANEDLDAFLERTGVDPRTLNKALINASREETRLERLEREAEERRQAETKAQQERAEAEQKQRDDAELKGRQQADIDTMLGSGLEHVELWAEADPVYALVNLNFVIDHVLGEHGATREALKHATDEQLAMLEKVVLQRLDKRLARLDEVRASRAARRQAAAGGQGGAGAEATKSASVEKPASGRGAADAGSERARQPRSQVTQTQASETSGSKRPFRIKTEWELEAEAKAMAARLDAQAQSK